jgi:hypothetical protein
LQGISYGPLPDVSGATGAIHVPFTRLPRSLAKYPHGLAHQRFGRVGVSLGH